MLYSQILLYCFNELLPESKYKIKRLVTEKEKKRKNYLKISEHIPVNNHFKFSQNQNSNLTNDLFPEDVKDTTRI